MARKSFVLLVVGMVIFFLSSISSADIPSMINYQGKLTTATGGCLNDTVQMTFSIYPDTTGSPAEWTETQNSVIVKEGIFNVLLGSVNPISGSVFDGDIKYLGVQVEADPEMRPLKPMVSVAYAYRARSTSAAGGWVDDGTVVRLETSTDYVGIGTASPSEKLHVDGNAEVTGRINKARFGTDWVFSEQCRLAVDMAGNNVDNGEVHFGNTFNNQWVDMWFQYSNGYLMGNYIKYDGSTMTTGHFRLSSSGIILYSGTNAANSAGHAYWDRSNYDVLICEDSAANDFCEYWYSEQRH